LLRLTLLHKHHLRFKRLSQIQIRQQRRPLLPDAEPVLRPCAVHHQVIARSDQDLPHAPPKLAHAASHTPLKRALVLLELPQLKTGVRGLRRV